MQNNMHENAFTRFYLWAADVKYTMGLFFSFSIFMYLLMGLIIPQPVLGIDFFTALEMIIAAFIIGIFHQAFLPGGNKITKTRAILWILSGTLVTLLFCIVFKWFADFPLWCFIIFNVLTAMGIGFMIHLYHMQLTRETKRLNKKLEQFQNQKK